MIAEFEYRESSLLNWQGFNIDVNDYYGVASTHHDGEEHGDVYIYDLRRFVDNQNILDDKEVSIFPIPSRSNITIENNHEEITGYKIFSKLGQVMMAENNLYNQSVELNINHLTAGNYWIKVITESGHLYRKIIKM